MTNKPLLTKQLRLSFAENTVQTAKRIYTPVSPT